MLILKQISGAVCLLNSYSKFTLSDIAYLLEFPALLCYNKDSVKQKETVYYG